MFDTAWRLSIFPISLSLHRFIGLSCALIWTAKRLISLLRCTYCKALLSDLVLASWTSTCIMNYCKFIHVYFFSVFICVQNVSALLLLPSSTASFPSSVSESSMSSWSTALPSSSFRYHPHWLSGSTYGVRALALTGKFGIASAFGTLWLYTPEMFPTSLRAGVTGASSCSARIGGVAASYLANLVSQDRQVIGVE